MNLALFIRNPIEKGRRDFCEGIPSVADGSEAAVNCFGVRSCGRLPSENAPERFESQGA